MTTLWALLGSAGTLGAFVLAFLYIREVRRSSSDRMALAAEEEANRALLVEVANLKEHRHRVDLVLARRNAELRTCQEEIDHVLLELGASSPDGLRPFIRGSLDRVLSADPSRRGAETDPDEVPDTPTADAADIDPVG